MPTPSVATRLRSTGPVALTLSPATESASRPFSCRCISPPSSASPATSPTRRRRHRCPPRAARSATPIAHQVDDPLDHLRERQIGGVEHDRPGAGRSGECSRTRSRSSRIVCSASTVVDVGAELGRTPPRALARDRRSGTPSASASGATTVPMSRPSATQSPRASSCRCCGDHRPRAPSGSAAAREAASETAGARIAPVTSRPSSSTRPRSSPANSIRAEPARLCGLDAALAPPPARPPGTSRRSPGR